MTRTALLMLGLAAALPATAGGAPAGDDPFKMASIEQVSKMLGQPGVAVLDANKEEEFAKNHLPGALFVTGKKGDELARLLPADKSAKLVFYCYNPK